MFGLTCMLEVMCSVWSDMHVGENVVLRDMIKMGDVLYVEVHDGICNKDSSLFTM